MNNYRPPASKYIPVVYSNGKLAFKFDPERGLIEIQDRGVREVFDLSLLAQMAESMQERQVIGHR